MQVIVKSPAVKLSENNELTEDDLFGLNRPIESRGKYVFCCADEPLKFWSGICAYKARVVIVPIDQINDAVYHLEYVLGGGCVLRTLQVQIDVEFEKISELDPSNIIPNPYGNYLAIYAQYNCW